MDTLGFRIQEVNVIYLDILDGDFFIACLEVQEVTVQDLHEEVHVCACLQFRL
jgi:hypothetical protein